MIGEVEEAYQRIGWITYEQGRRNNLFTQTRTSKRNEMKKEMRVKNKAPIKNENAEITA